MKIELNEAQKLKWMRLLDNAKFKSANVGRASPVPTAMVRTSTMKEASELRQEIRSGKIRSKGAQYFLVIGPQCLRWLLPLVTDDMTKNYSTAELVTNWLNLLDNNVNVRGEKLKANRAEIEKLKMKLIKTNRTNNKPMIDNVPGHDVDVLRAELTIYTRIPEGVRNAYQDKQMAELFKKIATLDEDGPEAKMLGTLREAY